MSSTSAKSSEKRAVLELIAASLFWGFGFIAIVWAIPSYSPVQMNAVRFLAAGVIGFLGILLNPRWRKSLNLNEVLLACIPGLLLGTTLVLQTWGLSYTTATKSSFITCLYVLLVPVLESLFLKTHPRPLHWLFVLLALVGTALICQLNLQGWNMGDGLTLLCAFSAALHILFLGIQGKKISSPFVFNTLQSLWAGVFSFLISCFGSRPYTFPLDGKGWIGILCLVFGSTLISFMLQVRAQKVLPPAKASLLLLLESPFAVFFALIFLNESLTLAQWSGATLTLCAIAASTQFSSGERRA